MYECANGERRNIYFSTNSSLSLPEHSDHFLILGVVASYLRSEPYYHSEPVDRVLFNNLLVLMERWQTWRGRKPITVKVAGFRTEGPSRHTKSTACLLTGGIDSLFTARSRKSDINTFINVVHREGLDASRIATSPNASLTEFSVTQNKTLITIETNMMSSFPEVFDAWASLAHGAGYAAAGHFLGQDIDRLMISASFSFDQLRPWGSHPETDALLSSDNLAIEHIGAATNRFEKLRSLSEDSVSIRHLSICEHGPQSGPFLNCSKCQKCLRTMIGLDLICVSPDAAPTFDWSDYRPEKLKAFLLPGHVNCTEMLDEAEQIGRDDIASVLKDVIAYSKRYHWIVRTELFLRKRLSAASRHKAFLKRVRHLIYNSLNIKFRTLEARSEINEK